MKLCHRLKIIYRRNNSFRKLFRILIPKEKYRNYLEERSYIPESQINRVN